MATKRKTTGKGTNNEKQFVEEAVKKYDRAMAQRADIEPQKRKEAVEKYKERMHRMWEGPTRSGK